jgi:phosphoserine phosphatase
LENNPSMTTAPEARDPGATTSLPLVVDLDETLLKVDTLYELFVCGLFNRPVETLRSLVTLRHGIAAFKRHLSGIAPLDIDSLPVREELLAYIENEAAAGREIHLVTAADQAIAARVARRFPVFHSAEGTDETGNLKGPAKARRLAARFPQGFVYAGDSRADLAVWQGASAAIIVSANPALRDAVRRAGTPVELVLDKWPRQWRCWIEAIRPRRWASNLIVFVPAVLAWRQLMPGSLVAVLAMAALLCIAQSLTCLLKAMANLDSDRKHLPNRLGPFASGAIPLRDGLLATGIGLPLVCILAVLMSPTAGIWFICYVAVAVGFSFGWRPVPHAFIVALSFAIRILIGISAANLIPSAWL